MSIVFYHHGYKKYVVNGYQLLSNSRSKLDLHARYHDTYKELVEINQLRSIQINRYIWLLHQAVYYCSFEENTAILVIISCYNWLSSKYVLCNNNIQTSNITHTTQIDINVCLLDNLINFHSVQI